MKIGSHLKRIFSWNGNPDNERKLFVDIDGFDATLIRKDGNLFSRVPSDGKQIPEPADVGFYYELSFRSNGTNPEYPKTGKPIEFFWTQSLKDNIGIRGQANFIANSMTFSTFRLTEHYISGKYDPNVMAVGSLSDRIYPAHHMLSLEVYVLTKDSKDERLLCTVGIMPRKSDMATTAWRAAEAAPYLGMIN